MLDRLLRIWRSKTMGKSHVQEQVMFATTLKLWKRTSRRNKVHSLFFMLSSLYIVHLLVLFVLMSVICSCISVEYMYISRILAIHYFLLLGNFGYRREKQAFEIVGLDSLGSWLFWYITANIIPLKEKTANITL